MPWYVNHIITCKVLNRIARNNEQLSLHDLRLILDYATESIWRKQEQYYKNCNAGDFRAIGTCGVLQ